jgi:hypothetical protein
MTRHIDTTIDDELYRQIKERHMKMNYLIRVGFINLVSPQTQGARIQELEEKNQKLIDRLQILIGRVNSLENSKNTAPKVLSH